MQKIERFYTEVIGLQKLGEFENHDHYNDLFLGYKSADWHLEFTTSPEKPNSNFDDDDILVFYVHTESELLHIKNTLERRNIPLEAPKNPYWVKMAL